MSVGDARFAYDSQVASYRGGCASDRYVSEPEARTPRQPNERSEVSFQRSRFICVSGIDQVRLAGWTGLEPAASGVTGRRSNQLNYHP